MGRKRIAFLVLTSLFLIGIALAFNLTEAIIINSHDRQEGRIDGDWLIIENTNSSIEGYISQQAQKGKLDLYYEGHNILDDYLWIDADLVIDTVWDGEYGTHFSGTAETFIIQDGKGYPFEIYDGTFVGFYNNESKQIYVNLNSSKIDMSWVTFINQ